MILPSEDIKSMSASIVSNDSAPFGFNVRYLFTAKNELIKLTIYKSPLFYSKNQYILNRPIYQPISLAGMVCS